jgi:hypothetical protein
MLVSGSEGRLHLESLAVGPANGAGAAPAFEGLIGSWLLPPSMAGGCYGRVDG